MSEFLSKQKEHAKPEAEIDDSVRVIYFGFWFGGDHIEFECWTTDNCI